MRYIGSHAASGMSGYSGLRSGDLLIGRSGDLKNRVALADMLALAAAGLLLLIFFVQHGMGQHFYAAVGTTIAFAVVGRLARGVDTSGALAGGAVAFILASRDLKLFWVLLAVFLVTLAATRLGRARKEGLRVAEAEIGRSASQVMSNLSIAAAVLVPTALPFAALLSLAALAEVAADTTSSELGTAYPGRTVLITTGKSVPPGMDGGISVVGTISGAVAASIIAACAAILGLTSISGAVVIACAGTLGMMADSVLGAAFERRGYLNNNTVNLLSTAIAIGIAWMMRSS